ncbi:hypothetical protein Ancab_031568 [Ancistrocladus abbreviatus]
MGGANSFGESTIRVFAQHGAKVIITDVQDDKSISLCDDINSHGNEVAYIHCDVSSDFDLKRHSKVMILVRGRVILFTSSITTLTGGTEGYAYAMSKHAINGLYEEFVDRARAIWNKGKFYVSWCCCYANDAKFNEFGKECHGWFDL